MSKKQIFSWLSLLFALVASITFFLCLSWSWRLTPLLEATIIISSILSILLALIGEKGLVRTISGTCSIAILSHIIFFGYVIRLIWTGP
ncbi:hypothetical protein [Bacillus cereus]|uniref:hypothetical protein n=1 Tax=Bacillus cereus TaxID=1396 RepID=UPI003980123D